MFGGVNHFRVVVIVKVEVGAGFQLLIKLERDKRKVKGSFTRSRQIEICTTKGLTSNNAQFLRSSSDKEKKSEGVDRKATRLSPEIFQLSLMAPKIVSIVP